VSDRPRDPGSTALLEMSGVTVRFGGIAALQDADLTVERGRICGLIGPNGAGKTTLFNCVSRLYQPESGRISLDGQDLLALRADEVAGLGIARTFQNGGLVGAFTVLENVMLGAHHRGRAGFVTSMLWTAGARREERALREEARALLDRLGLADLADRRTAGLPWGVQKRVEMARALCAHPRLLMLDEPVSGLGHEEVDELADLVLALRDERELTILLVEHHMGMVMRISDHVVVLDSGRTLAAGTPAEVRRDPAVIEAYLGAAA
jgi:branched-chain amino acid transport system ATP-binding protein